MREIKYRVWCKNRNEWEKDSIVIQRNGVMYNPFGGQAYNSENHIIQLSTGLVDKHKIEIYEGDIIQTQHGVYTVSWDDKEAGFVCENKSAYLLPENFHKYEVVGHIHEIKSAIPGTAGNNAQQPLCASSEQPAQS